MRILTVGSLYPPHHLGGYELVWQAAVSALRVAGHDVRVLAVSDRLAGVTDSGNEPGVHRELHWYWSEHRFPSLSLRDRIALERHNHDALARQIADQNTELVSWWAMGGMSLSLLESVRRSKLPALGWVNDDWLIYGPRVDQWTRTCSRRGTPSRLLERLSGVPAQLDLARAARWIFCSDATRRATLERRPELIDTDVLHQGVAAEFTEAPQQPWAGRLLYAGRLDERKGLTTLIDAVAELPDVTLLVLGDGDPEFASRLADHAHHRGASSRVEFAPAVSRAELALAYADSDAVVFPVEWFEPWGLVPLEAMAVGRPVIATGQGGSAEYLEHEGNTLLFAPGDAAALARAVRRLAREPELRARLCAGGLQTASRLTEARWTAGVVAEHESAAPRRLGAATRR